MKGREGEAEPREGKGPKSQVLQTLLETTG